MGEWTKERIEAAEKLCEKATVTEDVVGQALTVASGAQAVKSVAVAARATARIDDGSLGGYAPSDDGPTSL